MINNFLAHAAVLIIALPLLAHVVLRERPPKEVSRASGNAPVAGSGRASGTKGSPPSTKPATGAKARRSGSDGTGSRSLATRMLGLPPEGKSPSGKPTSGKSPSGKPTSGKPDAKDGAKKGRGGTTKRTR